MCLIISFFKFFYRVMGIDLGGSEGRVPEHLLYAVKLSPVVKQLRGYGMSQHVGRFSTGDALFTSQFPFHRPVHILRI